MPRRRTPMETFSFRAPRDVIEAGRRTAEKRDEYLGDALRDLLTRYARDEIRAARTAKPAPAPVAECICVYSCADDPATACSLSGEFHTHPNDGTGVFGPCPVHPEAPTS